MTNPIFKIEVYDPTPALRYTITKDAANIKATTKVNDVGTFNFIIPARIPNGTQAYPNIALGDTVKIFFGSNGVLDTTNYFLGRIYQTHGSLNEQGYIRTVKGKDMGEVLQRRYKTMDDYVDIDVDTLVGSIATDLGLGLGDIAIDGTHETWRIDIDKHKQYYQWSVSYTHLTLPTTPYV